MNKNKSKFYVVRDILGLNQHEMSQLLRVSVPTVRKYEDHEPLLNEEKRSILKQCGVDPMFILESEFHSSLLPGVSPELARELARGILRKTVVQS
jgi:hypothetical protein